MEPCIVLDRHVCSQRLLRGAGSMYKPVWLCKDESQHMHASSYLPRFPKPVSHTNGRSLAPAWPTTFIAYSLWLALVQNSFLSLQCPLSFSACLSQSLQCSLCCNVFPVPGLPVCGSWWSGVECREEGGRQACLKGDVQLFPHTASTPHWSVAHSAIWWVSGPKQRMQRSWNYGCTVDTRAHTAIELMLHSEHTKWE